MSLLSLLKVPDDRVLEKEYYVMMESHIDYLRKHPETQTLAITHAQAEKYTGDFHGLLHFLSVDKKYHYLVTRVNGLKSSADYCGTYLTVMVPSLAAMSQLMTIYSSRED